ncbi:unnamed protein product [Oikopleura dioica]|uniref:BING4 C-terminal domain-containing protein n=1 Tax=Oikopleura dioica TaxID=34765 RepID=E4X3X5_OIKDI|nr:unnamed protein product [Oikopleura dioica]
MASKRAFLQGIQDENIEPRTRRFEEPENPAKKASKDEKDRFGPTPAPSGKEFLRDEKKINMKTAHIRLQKDLKTVNKRAKNASQKAEMLKILEPTEYGAMRKTGKIYSQKEIESVADVQTMQKKFSLDLDMGPYIARYDSSGRHLLLAGELGHVAMIDHYTKMPKCEFSVKEKISDAIFLQNEKLMAIAQKKWTYVYDNQGTEIHCLKKTDRVNKMNYLPYHFLLASINRLNYLSYIDISIGKEIYCKRVSEEGSLNVICNNRTNGIIHLGHTTGTVTLWSPNSDKFVAKMLCHRSNLISASVSNDGKYMATSSQDASLKIWDLRTWKCLTTKRLPRGAHQLQYSQRGLLAASFANVVELWKHPWEEECRQPIMQYKTALVPTTLEFCPYEDVLGIGSKKGFESILAPGAGEPNPDSWQYNPFQTKKQRAETEVRMLLEKAPVDTICLDPNLLAKLDQDAAEVFDEEQLKRVGFKPDRKFEPRVRKRGKGKTGAKEARKSKMREAAFKKHLVAKREKESKQKIVKGEQAKNVLARFMKKDD